MHNHTARRQYEKPAVSTVQAQQLLEALGPAQCWYGGTSSAPRTR